MDQEQQNLASGRTMGPIMAVKDWIITMIIMIIPVVNIIMLIVWATSQNDNPNRKNWALAQLIFMAIGVVLYLLIFVMIIGIFAG